MNFTTNYHKEFMASLQTGVKPALGCTEPVAVGIAVSKAYSNFKEEIEEISIRVSPNIYKNGKGVGIPNTDKIGLVFAAALAGVGGQGDLLLEVFKNIGEEDILKANKLLDRVKLDIETKEGNFFIQALVRTKNHRGICEIRNNHTNITKLLIDDDLILEKDYEMDPALNSSNYLHNISVEDIRDFVEKVDFPDIEFLLEGVRLNMDIANYGIEKNTGIGLGSHLHSLIEKSIIEKNSINEARMYASAACDARMSGVNMPVMSSAGSGNQGIAAIIPVYIVCRDLQFGDEKLARALAFSHLVTAYIKSYTGNLAPVCGCAIAAGIGASSSITWAMGGDNEQIRNAIRNMIGTLSGMFCDGAKGGCAFKIASATSESIIQAHLALNNITINNSDGILDPSIEQSIKNLARLCRDGMKNVDSEIIKIMMKN